MNAAYRGAAAVTYLHQPVEIRVQIAGECFINFNYRHKVLVGEQ